ncbi:hypothetical protein D9M68_617220 [compost metagenome]
MGFVHLQVGLLALLDFDAGGVVAEADGIAQFQQRIGLVAVTVGEGGAQADQVAAAQVGHLVRAAVGRVEDGPLLVQGHRAVGVHAEAEGDQPAAVDPTDNIGAFLEQQDAVAGGGIPQAAVHARRLDVQAVADGIAGCGAVGTEHRREGRGETGAGVIGQHGFVHLHAEVAQTLHGDAGHVVDNVDGQGAGAGVAVGVGHLEGEGLGELQVVAVIARIDLGRRIQGVAVTAIAVDHQLAVLAGTGAAGQAEAVGAVAAAADQGAAGDLVVARRLAAETQGRLAHLAVGTGLHAADHGDVGDINGQGGGADIAIGIDDAVGEGIDGAGRGHAVGMAGVAVAAIGVQHQGAQAGVNGYAHATRGRGRGIAAGAHAHHA